MAETIIHKIIARAAKLPSVNSGDIVTAEVDLAFAHDSSGPRRWQPLMDEVGIGLKDPDKVAIVTDHYVPAVDADSAEILRLSRQFASDHKVNSFFDMIGIVHVVLPEKGLIRPGEVPRVVKLELNGRLSEGVVAKDLMLFLCRELGLDNAFTAFEFTGSAVDEMAMMERMVLSNMTTELGGEAGIIAPDQTTLDYLAAVGRPVEDEEAAVALASDPDAEYDASHTFDVGALAAQVAAPHSPSNTKDADQFGDVAIDQAYIGACVGAKLSDLQMAAKALEGRKVASGVRLLVAPASQATLTVATKDGTLETLTEAGAILLPSGCGACAGMGAGILAKGDVCISTTNRNFRGRMGHDEADVYLASPYTVAASAVAGRITDPREIIGGDS